MLIGHAGPIPFIAESGGPTQTATLHSKQVPIQAGSNLHFFADGVDLAEGVGDWVESDAHEFVREAMEKSDAHEFVRETTEKSDAHELLRSSRSCSFLSCSFASIIFSASPCQSNGEGGPWNNWRLGFLPAQFCLSFATCCKQTISERI